MNQSRTPVRHDRRPIMNEITAKQKATLAAINAAVAYRAKQPQGIASKEDMYKVFSETYQSHFKGFQRHNRIVA